MNYFRNTTFNRFSTRNVDSFRIAMLRWFCSVCRVTWEGICWLIIPAVFGTLFVFSYRAGKDISWMQFILAAMALSPWLLRLFTAYLSEFSFGLSGVSGKTKQTVVNKDEIDAPLLAVATNEAPQPGVNDSGFTTRLPKPGTKDSEFITLIPQAKKILRTLWKYQVEHFGLEDIRRWGFAVGTNAPDYPFFCLGLLELIKMHLVSVDQRGFAFLTNEGMEFCQKQSVSISAYPDYYSNFAN